MNKTQSGLTLRRRDFLRLTAAVGVTAVGGHLFDTHTPWLDDEEQAAAAA